MRRILAVLLVFGLGTPVYSADISVKLLAPWTGKKVPAGQQCTLDGGQGATPPMQIGGLPKGTVSVIVAFNDKSYAPLSRGGGHGIIGFAVKGSRVRLPSVPGMTRKLAQGVVVVRAARTTGAYASPGYLPPCSGGRGHRYVADIKAISVAGKVLGETSVDIGRY